MIKKQLEQDLKKAVEKIGYKATDIDLYIPQNPQFGDYTTNIALQLANLNTEKGKQSPQEIAKEILSHLSDLSYLSNLEVKGPGFINFFIKDEVLVTFLQKQERDVSSEEKKRYFLEYAQPNTHKAFHIGHLRNISLGESLARLLEYQGNSVFRATYGSDVGLPVAKALWGVKSLKEEYQQTKTASPREKAEFLGKAYAIGAGRYEDDQEAKKEIERQNIKIYQKDPNVMGLWEETRQWSIDYFSLIYQKVGTSFDRMFWESEVERKGREIVNQHLKSLFTMSGGAIIFPGEEYGLHNRVFITSAGNPTYETKELSLAAIEYEAFPYDESWHIVANEQDDYFKVMIKVMEMVYPQMKGKKRHISYGMVNLTTGKMSSRTGEVVTADALLDQIKEKVRVLMRKNTNGVDEQVVNQVAVGAAKFYMLKMSPSVNISFDVEQSVALEGDTGPYLQYTYVRTQSVLHKAAEKAGKLFSEDIELSKEERSILVQVNHFGIFVEESVKMLNPNRVAVYLLNLAKEFNLFYQNSRIIGSDKEHFRLALTKEVGSVLKQGLYLLGIEAPDRM